ncbi:DUF2628 domain-containing protein [Tepidamorphus sp. 3E244]|uniref:DUF2628 domain-containing protein n=1 Tax=Tepidamorphus sp. 3E244 TaxID=3385498 RepID=UPI0038FC1E8F
MVLYTAHAPQGAAPTGRDAADKVVFIKDGFAFGGFIFTFFWLFLHRVWLAAIVVLALTMAISTIGQILPEYATEAWLVGLLLSLMVGLEGNEWRRRALERKGYTLIGVASGRDQAECERRILEDWIEGAPARPGRFVATPTATSSIPVPREGASRPAARKGYGGIVGMFPERGR